MEKPNPIVPADWVCRQGDRALNRARDSDVGEERAALLAVDVARDPAVRSDRGGQAVPRVPGPSGAAEWARDHHAPRMTVRQVFLNPSLSFTQGIGGLGPSPTLA